MADQPGTGVPRQPGEPRVIARYDWGADAAAFIRAGQEQRRQREAAERAEAARLDAYYTNETLMKVAEVLHDRGCPSGASCSDSPTTWTRYVWDAAEVLRALAAAGRLIPAGSKVQMEWSVAFGADDAIDCTSEDRARRMAERDGGTVENRRVITTPWTAEHAPEDRRG